MRSVGIEVFEGPLGEYLRAAEAGETLLVTEHGRVVAQLGPPQREARPDLHPVLADGVREGWLVPASRRGAVAPPSGLPHVDLQVLLKGLERDREDR